MKRSRATEEDKGQRMGEMPLRACRMEGTADVDELETGKWRDLSVCDRYSPSLALASSSLFLKTNV